MLGDSLKIAAAGMKAQGDRLRVIAENVANSDSTSNVPGGEPYRRKLVTFQNVLDKELGMEVVRVAKRTYDMSDFRKKFDPNHPAADEQGYVLLPNVSSIVEMMDMRESRRAYEANVNIIEMSKAMLARTLELLR
jgi:flagellar basal-body rod protein FlgC